MQRARSLTALLKRSCVLQHSRAHTSHKGGSEAKFKQKIRRMEDELRNLETKIDSSIKANQQKNVPPILDSDIKYIYDSLSAVPEPIQPWSKINANFLENLRLKFLDTRGINDDELKALEGNIAKQLQFTSGNENSSISVQEAEKGMGLVTEAEFSQLIYANALAKRPSEAEEVIELMKPTSKNRFQKCKVKPTLRCYNHLLDAHANVGDLQSAIATFKLIRTGILPFHLLPGYLHPLPFLILSICPESLVPDIYTFSALIKAFVSQSRLNDAFVIFDRMRRGGLIPTQPVFATLISGCVREGKLDRAWATFDEMRLKYHKPDEVTYSLMIQACAKKHEVERALNLFTELSSTPNLYPTDVTFNTLISACATRSDYFDEAFSLLAQMQDVYGFLPDLVTYNTLLQACARRGELARARIIFGRMAEAREKGEEALAPDDITYSNLMWCYASYRPPGIPRNGQTGERTRQREVITTIEKPPRGSQGDASSPTADLAVISPTYPLLPKQPVTRAEILEEADSIFAYLSSSSSSSSSFPSSITNNTISPPPLTSSFLNAYLSTHGTHQRPIRALEIYTDLYSRHGLTHDGHSFVHALDVCYQIKDAEMAWKVWEEAEKWWEEVEGREAAVEDTEENVEVKRKARKTKEYADIGFTEELRYERYKLMVNTLARCDDLSSALRLLSTLPTATKEVQPLRLADFQTTYNKCIQLEDPVARRELLRLCPLEQGLLAESKAALARKWGPRDGRQWKWEIGPTKRGVIKAGKDL
ncbi:hypothetical protein BC937DRAFT_93250 [Endogone sp. FLAS-F59071]|nr:hypothetical protein BC937DRAFT_93250 [Endogone sp. FLAS-F59071]|eukprot:RUS14838.1 hypothetical protein BC937DRAFT_93250 [Endogone sp. FLAS-F59071]